MNLLKFFTSVGDNVRTYLSSTVDQNLAALFFVDFGKESHADDDVVWCQLNATRIYFKKPRGRLVCQEWCTLKELEEWIERKASTDTALQSSKVGDSGIQPEPPKLPDALSGTVLHFQSYLFLHYLLFR